MGKEVTWWEWKWCAKPSGLVHGLDSCGNARLLAEEPWLFVGSLPWLCSGALKLLEYTGNLFVLKTALFVVTWRVAFFSFQFYWDMIDVLSFSRYVVSDSSATPRTVAHQALLSMGFSRQDYWSRLLFLSPGDLPDPRIEPESPVYSTV